MILRQIVYRRCGSIFGADFLPPRSLDIFFKYKFSFKGVLGKCFNLLGIYDRPTKTPTDRPTDKPIDRLNDGQIGS